MQLRSIGPDAESSVDACCADARKHVLFARWIVHHALSLYKEWQASKTFV